MYHILAMFGTFQLRVGELLDMISTCIHMSFIFEIVMPSIMCVLPFPVSQIK